VIGRAHVQEQRLFDAYLAERSGAPVDPPVAEHLTDCDECGARYAELSAFMDAIRHQAEAEQDAVFTPDRLRAQQQQILRRIELVGRPARILSFPTRLVRRTIGATTGRSATRWIAAAAAAGLFVGVALGASYQWNTRAGALQALLARDASGRRLATVGTRGSSPAEIAADTAFLSDLELALERPHTPELRAFDALTPHVREIRDQR
jgi:predicted anti-sigma-YlaC factor YlaD